MSNLTNRLLNALDIIVDSKLSEMGRDITVEAEVLSKQVTGKYTVTYNGTTYENVSANGSYGQGDIVLMLVPQGDYSKDKTILSKIGVTETDGSRKYMTFEDQYNLIGGNLVVADNDDISASSVLWERGSDENLITLMPNNRIDKPGSMLDDYVELYHKLKVSADFTVNASSDADINDNTTDDIYYSLRFTFANAEEGAADLIYDFDINDMAGDPYVQASVKQSKVFLLDAKAGALKKIERIGTFSISNLIIYGAFDPTTEGKSVWIQTPQGTTFNDEATSATKLTLEALVRHNGELVTDVTNLVLVWELQNKDNWIELARAEKSVANGITTPPSLTFEINPSQTYLRKSVIRCRVIDGLETYENTVEITNLTRPERYITAIVDNSVEQQIQVQLASINPPLTFQYDWYITTDTKIPLQTLQDDDTGVDYVQKDGSLWTEAAIYRCDLFCSHLSEDENEEVLVFLDTAAYTKGATVYWVKSLETYYTTSGTTNITELDGFSNGVFAPKIADGGEWITDASALSLFEDSDNRYLYVCEKVAFTNGISDTEEVWTLPRLLMTHGDDTSWSNMIVGKKYQYAETSTNAPAVDEYAANWSNSFVKCDSDKPYLWAFDYIQLLGVDDTVIAANQTEPRCFWYEGTTEVKYETKTIYCGHPVVNKNGNIVPLDVNMLPWPPPSISNIAAVSNPQEVSYNYNVFSTNLIDLNKFTYNSSVLTYLLPDNTQTYFTLADFHGSINSKELILERPSSDTIGGDIQILEHYVYYLVDIEVTAGSKYILYVDTAKDSDYEIFPIFEGSNSNISIQNGGIFEASGSKINEIRFDANYNASNENKSITFSNIRLYKIEESKTGSYKKYNYISSAEYNDLTYTWYWYEDVNWNKKNENGAGDNFNSNAQNYIYTTSQLVFNNNISPDGWAEASLYLVNGEEPGDWNLYYQAMVENNGKEGVFEATDDDGKKRVVMNASMIKTGTLAVTKNGKNILSAQLDGDDPEVTIAGWKATEHTLEALDETSKEVMYLSNGQDLPLPSLVNIGVKSPARIRAGINSTHPISEISKSGIVQQKELIFIDNLKDDIISVNFLKADDVSLCGTSIFKYDPSNKYRELIYLPACFESRRGQYKQELDMAWGNVDTLNTNIAFPDKDNCFIIISDPNKEKSYYFITEPFSKNSKKTNISLFKIDINDYSVTEYPDELLIYDSSTIAFRVETLAQFTETGKVSTGGTFPEYIEYLDISCVTSNNSILNAEFTLQNMQCLSLQPIVNLKFDAATYNGISIEVQQQNDHAFTIKGNQLKFNTPNELYEAWLADNTQLNIDYSAKSSSSQTANSLPLIIWRKDGNKLMASINSEYSDISSCSGTFIFAAQALTYLSPFTVLGDGSTYIQSLLVGSPNFHEQGGSGIYTGASTSIENSLFPVSGNEAVRLFVNRGSTGESSSQTITYNSQTTNNTQATTFDWYLPDRQIINECLIDNQVSIVQHIQDYLTSSQITESTEPTQSSLIDIPYTTTPSALTYLYSNGIKNMALNPEFDPPLYDYDTKNPRKGYIYEHVYDLSSFVSDVGHLSLNLYYDNKSLYEFGGDSSQQWTTNNTGEAWVPFPENGKWNNTTNLNDFAWGSDVFDPGKYKGLSNNPDAIKSPGFSAVAPSEIEDPMNAIWRISKYKQYPAIYCVYAPAEKKLYVYTTTPTPDKFSLKRQKSIYNFTFFVPWAGCTLMSKPELVSNSFNTPGTVKFATISINSFNSTQWDVKIAIPHKLTGGSVYEFSWQQSLNILDNIDLKRISDLPSSSITFQYTPHIPNKNYNLTFNCSIKSSRYNTSFCVFNNGLTAISKQILDTITFYSPAQELYTASYTYNKQGDKNILTKNIQCKAGDNDSIDILKIAFAGQDVITIELDENKKVTAFSILGQPIGQT